MVYDDSGWSSRGRRYPDVAGNCPWKATRWRRKMGWGQTWVSTYMIWRRICCFWFLPNLFTSQLRTKCLYIINYFHKPHGVHTKHLVSSTVRSRRERFYQFIPARTPLPSTLLSSHISRKVIPLSQGHLQEQRVRRTIANRAKAYHAISYIVTSLVTTYTTELKEFLGNYVLSPKLCIMFSA